MRRAIATLDPPVAPTVGLIVLEADHTLEREARTRSFDVYVTRIPMDVRVTPHTLARMEAHLTSTAAQLPPVDVLAYACTSGAMLIGPVRVAERLRAAHPRARFTDPFTALLAALAHRGATRVALLTPYTLEVTTRLVEALAEHVTVTAVTYLGESDDTIVARISAASLATAVRDLVARDPDAQAVAISCTNLRTADLIPALETEIGRPVVSSNQALLWQVERLLRNEL